MFETVSTRMPRTVRRPLSDQAIANLDALAQDLDRDGANSRTNLRDASNDDVRLMPGMHAFRARIAA